MKNNQQNENFKGRKNNKNYRKNKMKPIYFTNRSDRPDNDCFFDMVDSMIECCPEIEDFMNDIGIDSIQCFDDYVASVADYMASRVPQLEAKKNIHNCLSISANRVHVRVGKGVAFTFELKYQIVDKVAQIISCVGTVILYEKNDDLVNTLTEAGWEKQEK